MKIDLLFENDDFVVINKPIEVPMHGKNSLVCYLKAQLNNVSLFLVHRLDTPTSGCMVLAKNQRTAATFGELFESRCIDKLYLALSDKKPKKKQGKIVGDMSKARNGSYMLNTTQENPAITQLKSYSVAASIRLFVCRPKTGKTHQIRVCLKSLSAPILGDIRYKGTTTDRLYLHSYRLAFSINNIHYDFKCLPTQGSYFEQCDFDTLFELHGRPEHIVWPH